MRKLDADIKNLVNSAYTGDRYFETVSEIAKVFPESLVEQLGQLVNDPTWDGDVVSKADRDRLLDMNIAVRVCMKGQQGFTGARYIGSAILKEIEERRHA